MKAEELVRCLSYVDIAKLGICSLNVASYEISDQMEIVKESESATAAVNEAVLVAATPWSDEEVALLRLYRY